MKKWIIIGIILGLGLIIFGIISTIKITEKPPEPSEKPSCPYACCENELKYKDKLCSSGYNCVNYKCVAICNEYECNKKDTYVGSNFCKSGNIYKKYLDYSCSLLGCTYKKIDKLQKYCSYGCTNGECIIHQVEMVEVNVATPKKYADFEEDYSWYSPNEVFLTIKNDGNVDETLLLTCDANPPKNIFLPEDSQKVFTFKWNPRNYGNVQLNCKVSNSYINKYKSKSVYVTESEWGKFNRLKPSGYTSCYGVVDCNDYAIKNLAESLMAETPGITFLNNLNWVYSNIEYDLDYAFENLFPSKASTVLSVKKGVCAQMSLLFTAISRAQGIPVRPVTACAVSQCAWWDLFCGIPRILFGTAGHAYAYSWIYEWIHSDPTWAEFGKSENVLYYEEIFCDISDFGDTSDDCFTHERCKKWR